MRWTETAVRIAAIGCCNTHEQGENESTLLPTPDFKFDRRIDQDFERPRPTGLISPIRRVPTAAKLDARSRTFANHPRLVHRGSGDGSGDSPLPVNLGATSRAKVLRPARRSIIRSSGWTDADRSKDWRPNRGTPSMARDTSLSHVWPREPSRAENATFECQPNMPNPLVDLRINVRPRIAIDASFAASLESVDFGTTNWSTVTWSRRVWCSRMVKALSGRYTVCRSSSNRDLALATSKIALAADTWH